MDLSDTEKRLNNVRCDFGSMLDDTTNRLQLSVAIELRGLSVSQMVIDG